MNCFKPCKKQLYLATPKVIVFRCFLFSFNLFEISEIDKAIDSQISLCQNIITKYYKYFAQMQESEHVNSSDFVAEKYFWKGLKN